MRGARAAMMAGLLMAASSPSGATGLPVVSNIHTPRQQHSGHGSGGTCNKRRGAKWINKRRAAKAQAKASKRRNR